VTWLVRVSRAWRRWHAFKSSSDWFIALFDFVMIGQIRSLDLDVNGKLQ